MIAHEFVADTLGSIDRLQAQLAVFPFFSDERPLRGPAGLADWRLGGMLSRKLMASFLEGSFGEQGIVVAPGKLRVEGILLFGLGPSGVFREEHAAEASSRIARAIGNARATTVALALPGRSLDTLPALRAMELWLAAEPEARSLEEVSVLEAQEKHRALAALVDGLRRQADSPLT